ncbi:MAG: hypothetical protein ACPGVB_13135 [Chitinophagales bacterium]
MTKVYFLLGKRFGTLSNLMKENFQIQIRANQTKTVLIVFESKSSNHRQKDLFSTPNGLEISFCRFSTNILLLWSDFNSRNPIVFEQAVQIIEQ